jgi:hypothetical protein
MLNNNKFKHLLVNFNLFFSKMFLCGLSEDDLDIVQRTQFLFIISSGYL